MTIMSSYQTCSSCMVENLCGAARRCLSPDLLIRQLTAQHNLGEQPINSKSLTDEDIINISNAIMNDYIPHEEPFRSAILKLHRIAHSLRK